jgi:hypothetical protein
VSARLVPTERPIDLGLTLGPMRRGRGDPTMRTARGVAERASRTPDGPVSVRFAEIAGGIELEAWGPGARLLERATAWCGAEDDDAGFDPQRGLVRDLWRRHAGLRIPRTGLTTERLYP